MKKTTKKLSLGMKIASILACLAIVSVGFASWWIVKMPDQQLEQGSFKVYGVETKDISYPIDQITFVDEDNIDDNESLIIFGKPTSTLEKPWLGYDNEVADSHLATILQFKAVLTSNADDKISDYMTDMKVDLTIPQVYADILVNTTQNTGYVAAPVLKYRLGTSGDWQDGTVTNNGNVYTITMNAPAAKEQIVQVKLEFAWSYYYGDTDETKVLVTENPYTYFNGLEGGYTTRRAEAAKAVLTNVNTKLATAQFDIKIYSTPIGAPATTEANA